MAAAARARRAPGTRARRLSSSDCGRQLAQRRRGAARAAARPRHRGAPQRQPRRHNAKLNEVQSAFGLLTLNYIDKAIEKRKEVSDFYKTNLSNVPGITLPNIPKDLTWNYSYYPIIIDKDRYGKTRDEIYLKLKENKILSRRYFYPLITDFNIYNQYKTKTPTAEKISENVICLPIHHLLSNDDLNRIINIIKYDYK